MGSTIAPTTNSEAAAVAETVYSFGPFRLIVAARQLTEAGRNLRLGSRAFDILHLLVSRAGMIVEKQEIFATVWSGLTVEDANLRVHVTALRKVLGDGHENRRFILNEPGRGYRFIFPVQQASTLPSHSETLHHATASAVGKIASPRAIPPRLARVIGREAITESLAQELLHYRSLSIVGTGGIGKTTVALAVAEQLTPAFAEAVAFVDLAPLAGPHMVANEVAAALGLPVRLDDESTHVIAALRDRRLLLILDNCEHVIAAVAHLAETILDSAPAVRLLATSREPLAIAGERVRRLVPLSSPAETVAGLTEIAAYTAVQLFVERAAAQSGDFALTDANAPLIAEICRRLDGLPLAIELAAARIEDLGVEGLASRLDDRFRLLTRGRRTSLPRQRTLRLTLDWSHDLLLPTEQTILRRLGIFAGSFSLTAAEKVTTDRLAPTADVVEVIANLVAKSMLSADISAREVRYRLLETTRVYAREQLARYEEMRSVQARHAEHFTEAMEVALAADPNASLAGFIPDIDNVRIALEWAFSPAGDITVGVRLATVAAPLFINLSLLVDCTTWTRRALESLGQEDRGTEREMLLSTSFAMPLLFTQGNSEAVRLALNRANVFAKRLGYRAHQAHTLDGLYVFHMRSGHFRALFGIADQAEALDDDGPDRQNSADWMAGLAHYFAGQHDRARPRLERALRSSSPMRRAALLRVGVDHRVNAYNAYGRLLWMQGYPDRAAAIAERNIAEAEALDHPTSLTIALMWMLPIATWRGDFALADTLLDRLSASAAGGALLPAGLVGQGFRGAFAVRTGRPREGILLLQEAIDSLRRINSLLLEVILMTHLAEALSAAGRHDEAVAVVAQALDAVERRGETVTMPVLLQVKSDVLLAAGAGEASAADCLRQAHDWARRQGARAYMLRSLTKLATLQPNNGDARAALRTIYESFTEGLETSDLCNARCLLGIGRADIVKG